MSTAYITTFAAKLVDETSIKLTWTGSYSSVSVYQSTDREKTYTALTEYTEASSYSITSLTPNTVYFFYIIPYDSTGTEGSKRDTFITTPYNTEITSFYAGSPGMTSIPLYWDGIYYNIRLKYKRYDQSDDYITEIYPITGVPSYIVTGLDVDTSYNFQIVPYDLNDFSGTASDIIYTKTDYLAYVGNIYLGTVTSTTINVSWDGWFSYVALQYSTDNVSFDTKSSVYTSNGGSYTFKRLTPISDYYFRVVPYDEYYNVGTTSTSVSGETLAGFKTVATTSVSYNSAVLTWDGSYSYVEVYQSSDGGSTYDLIDTVTYSDRAYSAAGIDIFELTSEAAVAMFSSAVYVSGDGFAAAADTDFSPVTDRASTVSLSYTVDNLSTSTTYYFYLLPYYNGVLGTSSEIITITTDFNPDASFSVGTPTIYSIPLVFSTDGLSYPYYTYCHIELSTDNSTYYDVSYIYSVPTVSSTYTYYITDYSGVSALSPNFTYYFRVTPYSSYGTAGDTTYYGSQATLGNIDISTFDVSLVSGVITLNWSGYFKSTYVQYTTDDFTGSTDISSVLIYRSADYADDTTELISSSYTASSLSTSQTYYFRLKPVNYNGDIGAASASRYNASISGVYLSNISSTGLTVNWTGTYSTVTVQSSTDGSTYSNVSGATDISGSSVDITTSTSSVKYYRIIPYSSNGDQGATSSTAYIPIVSSPTLSVTDVSTVSVSWSGTNDYAAIMYSTDNSTYKTATTDVTSPASVSFYGMDASNQTYYFKVVPYGHGYPTSTSAYDVSGTSSSAVYNATISTAYFVAQTGSSIYNSLKVYWKGTYAGLYIYYDVSYNFPNNTYTQIAVANSGSSLKNTTISSLLSNTTYYFKLVPYNSNANNGLYYPIISGATSSLLTGLNLAYSASNSTSSSVRLTWSYNNYYYIKLYNSSGTLQGTYYSTTTSVDISGLAANTAYDFYAVVYDTTGNSETTSNVTTYTSASSANLNMTYVTSSASGFSINPKKVIFSWDNSGYYSIGIQNTTNSSSTTTYYSSDGTTSYDSFSAGEGNLVQNTYYTYTFTLKNAYGTSTTFTKKVDTLGTISSFDISAGATFTSSQIPIEFTGIYNYVIVDVSDGTTRGNTYIYGIGSGSSSVYNSYNLTSSNSVISQANKTYWITVYPVNDASDVGLASNTYSAKTLGAITSFYSPGVLDNSSIAIYWDGSYAGVILESATNSSFSENYINTSISDTTAAGGAGSGGYTYNGLQPNTKYYFRVTPVNQPLSDGNDVSGTTVTNDVSGTTLGILTSLYTAAYYDTSAVVAFDGSFASIDISTNGVTTTYSTARTTGVDISNLTPGATYTVTTTVRNSVGATIAGNSISFTTRSKITDFTATALDSSSISVAWTATGALSYVTLVWNTTGGAYNASTDSNGTYYTSPAYISGLSLANARYYFQITPTSSVGDGYKVMDASDITWGKLNSFYVDTSNITATSIPLKWDGSFNRLIIQQSLDGVTYLDASSVVTYDSSGTTLNTLYNNTMYYIRAVPISDASAAGTTTAAITGTTLAYIGNVYASSITSSAFTVNVDVSASSYSSFYVVNTTANKTSNFVTYPDYSVTFDDLSANTSFDVVVYAYNYNETDGSGTVVLYGLSGTTTLATITGAATANVFTDLSSAYYSITLYGYYTSFKLQYTIDGTTYDTSYADYGSKITVSDLSANTTYTYTAYANNKSGGAGTDVTQDFTVTTLGSTPSFNAKTSPDYSQVNSITFDIYRGDYAAVRVKTSTTVDMSSGLLYTVDISDATIATLGNVYVQTDLSVNTKYYFNSTPINSAGTLGNSSTTLPLATLGNLTAVSLTSPSMIGTEAIPVSWSGAYNTMLLEYAKASELSYSTFATYSNSTTPTYTIINANVYVTGLSPNTAYYFRATPYSLDSLAGTTLYIEDVSAMTLPTITTSTITTTIYDTSAVITFDGSFSKVRIYSSPTSLDKTYTWSLGGISTGTDISGLTANTSYVFYYVPYNSNNVTNPIDDTPVYSSTFYTQPLITSNRTVITDTSSVSIAWAWSGSTTSATTEIATSTDGTTYTYNTIALVADTSNTIANLEANTRYYFALTPKAQSDTSGYTVYISDTSATTLGNITTLSNTATSDLSAAFSLTGAFSGFKIYNPVSGSYTAQTATNSSVISLYNLTANTSYAFSFYPQNSYGTYNAIAWSPGTVTTLGNITAQQSNEIIDASSIVVGWKGNFASVSIAYSTDDSNYTTYSTGVTGNSKTILGLSPNTRYYFRIIPVNSSLTNGLSYYIKDASAITMGNVVSMSTAYVGYSELSFNLYGNFSGIKAHNTTASVTTYHTGTNYVATGALTGLSPNKAYTFRFYAQNSFGYYSSTYYEKIHYTTPYIRDASASPASSSSLTVAWDLSGTSNSNVVVHIYTSSDGSSYTYSTQSTAGSQSTVLSGLSTNTKYYLRLIPKGYSDTSGSKFDISGYTYGSIATVTYSSLDASAVKITATGTFTKARVYNSSVSFNKTYTA